jgi:aldehyde dehydrogenase (NAD+)
MDNQLKFYIDGAWVDPVEPRSVDVVNPATEAPIARVSLGGAADVDRAVGAARRAFERFSRTSREERLSLLERIIACYEPRIDALGELISAEMGAPRWLARGPQARAGLGHLASYVKILKEFQFEEPRGNGVIVREPIGVCGFITPWNWPVNQIMCKVAPALAAGCTMVLKPSELTPLSAILVAEILDEAGVPPGVFNLVNGDGSGVGAALSAHPGVDMISFTGSTRAGALVAKAAADTVKRVTQELGGKSPNIILPDADLERAVAHGVTALLRNSGQSCNAPSRMLVHESQHDAALAIAKAAMEATKVGDPSDPETKLGPVANRSQYEKIQGLIQKGIDEGATLVCGGLGKPEGLATGYYVRPTLFGGVTNDMTIAREEIFGPVLSVIPYADEEEAIRLANDTDYGLSAYVQSGDRAHAVAVGARLRAGQVHINGTPASYEFPFGGYKRSGNGREWGVEGLLELLETKAMMGVSD